MNQWEFLSGDTELLPGITAVVTAGHTRFHQSVKIESEGKTAFFLGDLIPTVSHLPLPYIMGYDLYPMDTLFYKKQFLAHAIAGEYVIFFEHDPKIAAGIIRSDGRRNHVEPIST